MSRAVPAEGRAGFMRHQLPARPVTWPADCLAWAGAAVLWWGAAGMLGPGPGPRWAGTLLLALAAAGSVVTGRRRAARDQLHDRVAEGMVPVLGLPGPDRAAVRLSRWRGMAPRRIVLSYAARSDDADPVFGTAAVEAAQRRVGRPYRVVRHDQRRCRMVLALDTAEQEQVPAQVQRAQRLTGEVFGPGSKVSRPQLDGEQLQSFSVAHQAGAKVAVAQYRARVERVVSALLPGRWRARWDLEGDRVQFEQRPHLPTVVDHPRPDPGPASRYRLPLALGEDGQTISWNLRGTGPHFLVIGRTGSGKTVVINGAVMEACARGFAVWVCDPKRIEFLGLRAWPGVQIVATTLLDQIVVIHRAWQEMERRYELIEAGELVEEEFEPLIVVLDEYRDLVGQLTGWWAGIKVRGMPAKCPVMEWVSSLARKGRSARVHLLMGTQRPDSEWLSGEMRDNFATRLSLGRLSPQGAQMMWDQAWVGVSTPRGIPGRATAVDDDDEPLECQAYWTPDPRRAVLAGDQRDKEILRALLPTGEVQPRLRSSAADLTDEDGEPLAGADLWAAICELRLVEVPDDGSAEQLVRSLDAAAALSPVQRLLAGAPALPAAAPAAFDPAPVVVDDSPLPDWPDEESAPVGEEGDWYGEEMSVPVSRVAPGDLTPGPDGGWVVVEAAEPDPDTGEVWISWRDEGGQDGDLVVDPADEVRVRRMEEAQ